MRSPLRILLRSAALVIGAALLVGCNNEPETAPPPVDQSSTPPVASEPVVKIQPPETLEEATAMFLTDKYFAAVVARPLQIQNRKLVQELYRMESIAEDLQAQTSEIPVDWKTMEWVMILAAPTKTRNESSTATLFKMESAEAADIFREKMNLGDSHTYKSHTIYAVKGKPFSALFLGDSLIANGSVPQLEMLIDRPGKPSAELLGRLEKVGYANDIAGAAIMAPIRSQLAADAAHQPPEFAELPNQVKAVSFAGDLDASQMISVLIEGEDEKSAQAIEGLVHRGLAMAEGQIPFLSAALLAPRFGADGAQVLADVANKTLQGIAVERRDSDVSLVLTAPDELRQLPQKLDPLLAEMKKQQAAMQTPFDLKRIGLAFLNYHETNGKFPPAALADEDGKPLLSWRVALLPFLDEGATHQQFHLDEPWDSPHNLKLAERPIAAFAAKKGPDDKYSRTRYQVFASPNSLFGAQEGVSRDQVTDGVTNTLLVIETNADQAVPWSKPADLTSGEDPLAALGEIDPQGVWALFADGHVQRLTPEQLQAALPQLISFNGGEVIELPPSNQP